MNPRRILLIGPSGSGKTTIAKAIARELGLPVLSMDDFRVKSNRTPEYLVVGGQRVRNYEAPSNWDANALTCKLRACCQAGAGFVAEGNHLLAYPGVAELAAHEEVGMELYYLDVVFAISLARRKQRNRGTEADRAFALIGEQETARWVAPQKAFPGVRALDGTAHTYVTGSNIIHRDFIPAVVA